MWSKHCRKLSVIKYNISFHSFAVHRYIKMLTNLLKNLPGGRAWSNSYIQNPIVISFVGVPRSYPTPSNAQKHPSYVWDCVGCSYVFACQMDGGTVWVMEQRAKTKGVKVKTFISYLETSIRCTGRTWGGGFSTMWFLHKCLSMIN